VPQLQSQQNPPSTTEKLHCKIAHEHIYWDQASVLVQIGLLNPASLPVSGAESARKGLDPSLPSRAI